MSRKRQEKRKMPAAPAPESHEVGPGPTPGISEGVENLRREDEEEVGPGPTPGNAEGEPDHINDDLMHQM